MLGEKNKNRIDGGIYAVLSLLLFCGPGYLFELLRSKASLGRFYVNHF